MENGKELYQNLTKTVISNAILEDVIGLYADHEIPESDREEFEEHCSDEEFRPVIYSAVLNVVIAITAALQAENEDSFGTVLSLLDFEEVNQVLQKMQLIMLVQMEEAVLADLATGTEDIFTKRATRIRRAIG